MFLSGTHIFIGEMRADLNCFNGAEEPYYHALSMAIEALNAYNDACEDMGQQKSLLSGGKEERRMRIEELRKAFDCYAKKHEETNVAYAQFLSAAESICQFLLS